MDYAQWQVSNERFSRRGSRGGHRDLILYLERCTVNEGEINIVCDDINLLWLTVDGRLWGAREFNQEVEDLRIAEALESEEWEV